MRADPHLWGPSGLLLLILSLAGCGRAGSYAAKTSDPGTANAVTQLVAQTGEGDPSGGRRIIHTAEVTLGVAELSAWEKDLQRLVRSHAAYLAGSEMSGEPGTPRAGTWKVRVPVTRYADFLHAVQQAGEVERVRTDSQDVSEEFVDVEARARNRRMEEARLLEHLRRSTVRLSDILTVEKELSRVREEIERLEGRLRFLRDRTEYSLVTLVVAERRPFVPARSPGLGTEMARVWSFSAGTLGALGRGLLLTLVALGPWMLLGTLIGLPAWRLLRRSPRP